VAKFLLDANLSPRVARFLVDRFQLDVTSLQGQRLGALPDHEVISLVRRHGRVVITLDQDDSDYFPNRPRQTISIIHRDLPTRLRHIPTINERLEGFFVRHAAAIELERSSVGIHGDQLVVHRGGQPPEVRSDQLDVTPEEAG
jgi:predicted nuclease of predicted toxin-antitoxin system